MKPIYLTNAIDQHRQETFDFSNIAILANSRHGHQFPASVELIAEINVRKTGEPTVC